MPQNTNEGSIPASVTLDEISGADVDRFMQTLGAWAEALPRREQALLHLMLAAAASVEQADVSEYLSGFPIPNPRDIIIAATGSASGAQSGNVVAPVSEAIAGDMSDAAALGAAGGALARSLLNNWGERQG